MNRDPDSVTFNGAMVKPRTKITALVLGLMLPYMAVVMYFSFRIQEHPLPTWFPYFGLSYMLGTISFVVLFGRKISGSAKWASADPAQRSGLRLSAGYLILVNPVSLGRLSDHRRKTRVAASPSARGFPSCVHRALFAVTL